MNDKTYTPPTPIRTPDREKIQAGIRLFLQGLGFELSHPDLRDTPRRVEDAWVNELLEGYQTSAKEALGTPQIAPSTDPIYSLGIPFVCVCPHHLLPVSGHAFVGFTPTAQVVGLSRIGKLVASVTRRLDIQENLAPTICDALMNTIGASGAGCVLIARHGCMAHRGIRQPDTLIQTSAFRGVFATQTDLRLPLLQQASKVS